MPKPKIDYAHIKSKILVIAYNEYVHDGALYNSVEMFAKFIGESKNVTNICIDPLVSDGLMVEGRKPPHRYPAILAPSQSEYVPSGTFTLTAKGRDHIEKMPDSTYDSLMLEMSEWTEWADDEVNSAVLDSWEPLSIDRSSQTYQDAIATSEKALEVIESSNGYAEEYPAERDSIVHSIKGTLDYVKNATPTQRHINLGLISPLKYLAEKFASSAIGEAAKIAVLALITWIGSLHA